jgi:predicted nucleic acid-binding protein
MSCWDTLAVVPLLVEQDVTGRMLDLLRVDPQIVTWWGTRVECVSALARLEREGELGDEGMATALQLLARLRASWHEVQPIEQLRESAGRALRLHALRAADGFQLAAALVVANHRPSTVCMVCHDARLTAAAQREGFEVIGE